MSLISFFIKTPHNNLTMKKSGYCMCLHACRCKWEDADITDSCGVTPLMDAARGNHTHVMEFLLVQCHVHTLYTHTCTHMHTQNTCTYTHTHSLVMHKNSVGLNRSIMDIRCVWFVVCVILYKVQNNRGWTTAIYGNLLHIYDITSILSYI